MSPHGPVLTPQSPAAAAEPDDHGYLTRLFAWSPASGSPEANAYINRLCELGYRMTYHPGRRERGRFHVTNLRDRVQVSVRVRHEHAEGLP